MMLAFTVALFSLLVGCSPLSPVYPKVIAADAKILSKCQCSGEVTGSAGEYISSLWRSDVSSYEIQIQDAKVRALQEAADLGATHVVWDGEKEKRYDAHIKARAYKCKKE